MFEVKIVIETDGDFGYYDPTLELTGSNEGDERVAYFEDRDAAADALVQSFSNVVESLYTRYDDIRNWVTGIKDKLELVAKENKTFSLSDDFGDQYISVSLTEVKKVTSGYGYFWAEVTLEYSEYSI